MSKVILESVVKQFGELTAVNDISYSVKDGDFFTIVGPSGCGKTTTLRMIAGFEKPTSGEIYLGDELINDKNPEDRDIGMVFQNYALFPHMNVFENIKFGLKMQNIDENLHDEKIKDMLDLIGLPEIGPKYPKELSGGQQQRVALARALVVEPDVLLLDEPLSNLDKKLRDKMQIELKRIQKQAGVTTIHVTHNQTEAMSLADEVCVMNNGVVEQIGPPKEVYDNPEKEFVADFLGESSRLKAELINDGTKAKLSNFDITIDLNESGNQLSEGIVIFRPEDVGFNPSDTNHKNVFEGTIETALFTGGHTRCEVRLKDANDKKGPKIIAYSNEHRVQDSAVSIVIPPHKVRFLKDR